MQSMMVPKGICDSIEEMARQFIWGASKGKRKWLELGGTKFVNLNIVEVLEFVVFVIKTKPS